MIFRVIYAISTVWTFFIAPIGISRAEDLVQAFQPVRLTLEKGLKSRYTEELGLSYFITTRFGELEFREGSAILQGKHRVKSHSVDDVYEDHIDSLTLFHLPTKEIVLVQTSCGGTGCPENNFFFLTISTDGKMQHTKWFDSLDEQIVPEVIQGQSEAIVRLPKHGANIFEYAYDGTTIRSRLIPIASRSISNMRRNKHSICDLVEDRPGMWMTSTVQDPLKKWTFSLSKKYGGSPVTADLELILKGSNASNRSKTVAAKDDTIKVSFPNDFYEVKELTEGTYTMIWRSENKKVVCVDFTAK